MSLPLIVFLASFALYMLACVLAPVGSVWLVVFGGLAGYGMCHAFEMRDAARRAALPQAASPQGAAK